MWIEIWILFNLTRVLQYMIEKKVSHESKSGFEHRNYPIFGPRGRTESKPLSRLAFLPGDQSPHLCLWEHLWET